ncbi:MAG TPA: S41 family peptidase [Tissierellaceae bacterium]|nr:S41 family peptidase [Tissierellaceae bacterium]
MNYINNHKTKILSLLLTLLLILPIPIQTYANAIDIDYVDQLIKIAEENYVQSIPREQHLENAIKGAFENLDQHSKYYNPEEFVEMVKGVDGNFVGIGVHIKEKDGYIVIVDAIDTSPAKKAGLVSGDIIFRISGESAVGITAEQAVRLIKGEAGSKVRLTIKRGSKRFAVVLKRGNIEINPVEYSIIQDVGYIKLDQFSQNSHKRIMEALDHMDENNIEDIILDLRDNPGGYLDQAIYIGNQFIKKGPITHLKYRDQDLITCESYLEDLKYNLILLVNERSASASELLAAAIKDTESGLIIGKKTFGKGTVQEIIPLKRGDGVKITRAEYFSPNMNKIEGIGVEAHIEVENKDKEDNQMKRAIQTFTNP